MGVWTLRNPAISRRPWAGTLLAIAPNMLTAILAALHIMSFHVTETPAAVTLYADNVVCTYAAGMTVGTGSNVKRTNAVCKAFDSYMRGM